MVTVPACLRCGARLATSAVGWLDDHLIGTANQTGRVGYVANMCTDPAYRRRRWAGATLVSLLAWLRSTSITTVDLHATPDGESLYRSLGFTEPTDQALTSASADDPPIPGRK